MKNSLTGLTADQNDCLQELMNISYGSATAAISNIIDKFATLSIPSIKTISPEELTENLLLKLFHNKTFFISSQLINGEFSGENLFIIDTESAKNLAREFGLEEHELIQEEIEDIILEITNILSSTTSSKLATLLQTQICFSSPTIDFISSRNDIEYHFTCNYENIIVISTNLKFQEQNIDAELVFMKNKDSFEFLQKRLDIFLNEY